MLVAKRLADTAPKVNLTNILHTADKAHKCICPGFETQGIKRYPIVVPETPQK